MPLSDWTNHNSLKKIAQLFSIHINVIWNKGLTISWLMLNKLDEKDFILVRKLFVAPTQIRNSFIYLIPGLSHSRFQMVLSHFSVFRNNVNYIGNWSDDPNTWRKIKVKADLRTKELRLKLSFDILLLLTEFQTELL